MTNLAAAPSAPTSPPVKEKGRGESIDFGPAKKAIHQQHVSMRVNDTLTERYSLLYLPASDPFSTACWHYEPRQGSSPASHVITFGANLADNRKEGANLADYSTSYHRHECAHSLWTQRDLKDLKTRCDAIGVPFPMLNIFEDARIEAKWRAEFDEKFDWSHYEDPRPVDPASPLSERTLATLNALIWSEGDAAIATPLIGNVPEMMEVWDFYDRTCNAKDALELYPIMVEWKAKYGVDEKLKQPEAKAGGSGATAGDLSAGLAVAQDEAKHTALMDKVDEQENPMQQQGPKVTLKGATRGGVLKAMPIVGPLDPKKIQHLVAILGAAFRGGEVRYKRVNPSKRISVRDYMLEREKIFKAKERQDAPKDTDVVAVHDCSGSMDGAPAENGRYLMAAMGALARQGVIRGTAIFSQVNARTEIACEEAIDLKLVDPELVRRIPADGCAEGLSNAMEKHRAKLEAAHCTIVYTDGAIGDAPIDRRKWHQRGVYTVGCYVGDPASSSQLKEWFDAPLCRSKVEVLAQGVSEMIRGRAVMNGAHAAMRREVLVEESSVDQEQEVRAGVSP